MADLHSSASSRPTSSISISASAYASVSSPTPPPSSSSKTLPPTSTRLSEKDKEKEKILPQLIEQLRQRVKEIKPLPDEPEFFMQDATLVRFIRAREYNLKDAEKQLRHTIEWRRKNKPLDTSCHGCRKKIGMHSIRQIGTDLEGRAVIYTCFEQCGTLRVSIESTVEHMVAMCESTIVTFQEGAPPSWTWVIDCHGITLSCCNPSLAQEVLGLLGVCYPEYLHRVIVTNHNTLFHNFWKLIRVFIDPKTLDKVRFVRKKDKLQRLFETMFHPETTAWLTEELRLNSLDKIPEGQKRFWLPPVAGAHDPRGTPTYVQQYIVPFASKYLAESQLLKEGKVIPKRVHRPHPNICDDLLGRVSESVEESNSSKNIPLISPAFDFIRDVLPFSKDEQNAKSPGSLSVSASASTSTSAFISNDDSPNAPKVEAADVDREVSDDEPEDDGSQSESCTGVDATLAAKVDSNGDAKVTFEQKQAAPANTVAVSVLDSISSATNKITTFFRDKA